MKERISQRSISNGMFLHSLGNCFITVVILSHTQHYCLLRGITLCYCHQTRLIGLLWHALYFLHRNLLIEFINKSSTSINFTSYLFVIFLCKIQYRLLDDIKLFLYMSLITPQVVWWQFIHLYRQAPSAHPAACMVSTADSEDFHHCAVMLQRSTYMYVEATHDTCFRTRSKLTCTL